MAVDIPNYRVIEKLGVGAQTRVFRARDMRSGQDYTIKLVKIVKPEDSSFIDLMKAEYTIGSQIDHPVVRKVYEFRLLRQRLRVRGAILFMEYVNGWPLADKEYRRPLDEILRVFGETAKGIHAMHQAGWVHADLKPNNILVSADGMVKLIDLGQSARLHEAKPKIQGTMDYMAPEQVQRGKLDQRTDVFGLGATLHRVLTGKAIATEMNQTVSMHSQSMVGRRVQEFHGVVRELPPCIVRLIDDCCRNDPDHRIADMPALIERIELARTIVATLQPETEPSLAMAETHDLDEGDPDRTDGFDAIKEALGLSDEDDDYDGSDAD